jgi:hypothetical protein
MLPAKLNRQSYGQRVCPQWGGYLGGRSWPRAEVQQSVAIDQPHSASLSSFRDGTLRDPAKFLAQFKGPADPAQWLQGSACADNCDVAVAKDNGGNSLQHSAWYSKRRSAPLAAECASAPTYFTPRNNVSKEADAALAALARNIGKLGSCNHHLPRAFGPISQWWRLK